jgi:hypothetical protein
MLGAADAPESDAADAGFRLPNLRVPQPVTMPVVRHSHHSAGMPVSLTTSA